MEKFECVGRRGLIGSSVFALGPRTSRAYIDLDRYREASRLNLHRIHGFLFHGVDKVFGDFQKHAVVARGQHSVASLVVEQSSI